MAGLPTLGDATRMGNGLWANCGGYNCGHGIRLDLASLIERYGADYPVRQPGGFMSRMRCTRCGHLGATPTLFPDGYDIAKTQGRVYIRLGPFETAKSLSSPQDER